jgi:hypothetical protein
MIPASSSFRSRRIVLAPRPNGNSLLTDLRLQESPVSEPGAAINTLGVVPFTLPQLRS